MSELNPLYDRASEQFYFFRNESWHVKNSIPILYSGNIAEYQASKLKIVTVALNPSNSEFLDSNTQPPYAIGGYSERYSICELENAYSSYFERRPYTRWFNSAYEKLLQRLDASYYGARYPSDKRPSWLKPQPNRSLHTDLCSPLVTNPNWSSLDIGIQTELSAKGVPLWHDLIATLRPHLVLISVSKRYMSRLCVSDWTSENPLSDGQSRHIVHVGKLNSSTIVWAQPQVVPFFHFGSAQRDELAAAIRGLIR